MRGTAADIEPACEGVAPLTAALEPWQERLLAQPAELGRLLDRHGSPLNLIEPEPFGRNLAELETVARRRGLPFRAFFARKANKTLSLVDRAQELGAGVDVASKPELEQSLARGVAGVDLVVTAAIKTRPLLELCCWSGATAVLDNADEVRLAADVAASAGRQLPVAFRLAVSGAAAERPPTRFGLPAERIAELADTEPGGEGSLTVRGIQFHVDGYDPDDRVRGLREALGLIDELRRRGRRPGWVDIGGGIPMRYLQRPEQWKAFWAEHEAALRGERPPLTYLGHGLGLRTEGGAVAGSPNVYPAAQELIRGPWLERVLDAPAAEAGDGTIAAAITARGLQLRCEPGRSLLDGCGMTVARVVFHKRGAGGEHLVGVEMNRTQMRTTADDSMLDPILLPCGEARKPGETAGPGEPFEGYLVGAYCIERELLTWRRLRFPRGVAVGDLLAFPNTAGYFMHILESSSHQMPLARNVVVADGSAPRLDPIDAPVPA